ncbi:hypothetical protein HMPREF1624_05169 [Sporothrix schenckii ATCC 58251]|uniref:Transcription factor domain-containing protein n=1 Tax=Sporothrix schenckii (strain ATCC 58251 / de Perez 2211183) TaxID=1391915 RepID=U7PVB6_SPOS1|nr:hypothetical protein HMPREF1624_05169 [Sporothrix schenckii ATCC 58251]
MFQHAEPDLRPPPQSSSSLTSSSNSVADLSAYCGVPQTLLWELVEIYFTHGYNASLLLHKDTFVHSLRAGTVTPHVLLSVCAWASKFYKDESGNYSLVKPGFGHEWATRAGSLVFAELVDPREENIVTFINLSLYWYSVGEWRRCYLLKWNAILISYNLNITSAARDDAARDDAARDEAQSAMLAVEMSRRRFWSSYLSMNFGSRVEFSTGNYSTAFAKVPLPCSDAFFASGMKDLDKKGDGSVYAELVRGLTLWNKISDIVKKTDVPKLTTLDSLHESLSQWWSNVPDSLKLPLELPVAGETRTQDVDGDAPSSEPQHSPLPLRLLLCVMYHQSICILHSSIVPLFSYRSDSATTAALSHSHLSLYSRHVSAQLAFEHAQAVSQLIKLSQRHYNIDPDRIPGFVSFAAYSACAVQIPFFWCSNQDVQTRARSNVLVNLRMIQQMGKHWKYVSLLGINSWTLYKTLSRKPPRLNDEPKFMDPSMLDVSWNGTDRAAKSIMSYSEIIWQSTGSYVERTDAEITDLGLSSRSRPSSVPPADGAVSSLIDELSSSTATTVASTFGGPDGYGGNGGGNGGMNAAGLYLSPPRFDTSLDFFMPSSPNDGFDFVQAQNGMISSQQLASFNTWLQQIESETLFRSPM